MGPTPNRRPYKYAAELGNGTETLVPCAQGNLELLPSIFASRCFSTPTPTMQVMTYYGGIKERKAKRVGWTKPNAFHVCITSYQMVLADASVFRRKKWHFLILDEAHYIKK